MKKGTELGLQTIKPKNKATTDALKELHYKANQLIFDYANGYINNRLKKGLIKQFTAIGKDISALDVPNTAKAKKEEILQALRQMLINLKEYTSDENESQMAKTCKFRVAMYLKNKNNDLSEAKILHQLKINKVYASAFRITDKSYADMQQELIDKLTEKYKI